MLKPKPLTILTLLAVAGLLVWLAVLPAWSERGRAGERLDAARQELDKTQRTQENILGATDFYEKLSQDKIEKINLALPENKDLPTLLVLLENTVQDNGLSLQDLSIAPDLSVSLSVRGSYGNVKLLIESLEKTLRLLDIASLNLEIPEDDPGVLAAKISGKVYYSE